MTEYTSRCIQPKKNEKAASHWYTTTTGSHSHIKLLGSGAGELEDGPQSELRSSTVQMHMMIMMISGPVNRHSNSEGTHNEKAGGPQSLFGF